MRMAAASVHEVHRAPQTLIGTFKTEAKSSIEAPHSSPPSQPAIAAAEAAQPMSAVLLPHSTPHGQPPTPKTSVVPPQQATDRVYMCPACHRSFSRYEDAQMHISMHMAQHTASQQGLQAVCPFPGAPAALQFIVRDPSEQGDPSEGGAQGKLRVLGPVPAASPVPLQTELPFNVPASAPGLLQCARKDDRVCTVRPSCGQQTVIAVPPTHRNTMHAPVKHSTDSSILRLRCSRPSQEGGAVLCNGELRQASMQPPPGGSDLGTPQGTAGAPPKREGAGSNPAKRLQPSPEEALAADDMLVAALAGGLAAVTARFPHPSPAACKRFVEHIQTLDSRPNSSRHASQGSNAAAPPSESPTSPDAPTIGICGKHGQITRRVSAPGGGSRDGLRMPRLEGGSIAAGGLATEQAAEAAEAPSTAGPPRSPCAGSATMAMRHETKLVTQSPETSGKVVGWSLSVLDDLQDNQVEKHGKALTGECMNAPGPSGSRLPRRRKRRQGSAETVAGHASRRQRVATGVRGFGDLSILHGTRCTNV
jgi:hypothetical protein